MSRTTPPSSACTAGRLIARRHGSPRRFAPSSCKPGREAGSFTGLGPSVLNENREVRPRGMDTLVRDSFGEFLADCPDRDFPFLCDRPALGNDQRRRVGRAMGGSHPPRNRDLPISAGVRANSSVRCTSRARRADRRVRIDSSPDRASAHLSAAGDANCDRRWGVRPLAGSDSGCVARRLSAPLALASAHGCCRKRYGCRHRWLRRIRIQPLVDLRRWHRGGPCLPGLGLLAGDSAAALARSTYAEPLSREVVPNGGGDPAPGGPGPLSQSSICAPEGATTYHGAPNASTPWPVRSPGCASETNE